MSDMKGEEMSTRMMTMVMTQMKAVGGKNRRRKPSSFSRQK